ncbi:MAG: AbrB/MazE/SpoVT family DNA-binding domain-containing protein [Telluria sp.]
MELSVQKWGKSAAVRLPTELLSILKVAVGDKLSVKMQPDGVLLKVVRPSYSLAELVAQCDIAAPEPVDMAAWRIASPTGRESL